ncbi:hypothetical protein E2C01_008019 [Portunus trituberculatus]|uniref:Uncharacterized protein n=1 Tax=Portunus trituberculatus TaxID=210409 RepID=A0A5B7D2T4_PORTR|nr:hypothetical protein [Portunus trituberculatus]
MRSVWLFPHAARQVCSSHYHDVTLGERGAPGEPRSAPGSGRRVLWPQVWTRRQDSGDLEGGMVVVVVVVVVVV